MRIIKQSNCLYVAMLKKCFPELFVLLLLIGCNRDTDVAINIDYTDSIVVFYSTPSPKIKVFLDTAVNVREVVVVGNKNTFLSELIQSISVYDRIHSLSIHGVYCDVTGIYIAKNWKYLDLSSNNIDSLRFEADPKSELVSLDLSSNNLIKFPYGLNDLKHLKKLNLSTNRYLTGRDFIAGVRTLRYVTQVAFKYCNQCVDFDTLWIPPPNIDFIDLRGNYLRGVDNVLTLPKDSLELLYDAELVVDSCG